MSDHAGQQTDHRMRSLLGRLVQPLETESFDLLDLGPHHVQARHVTLQLGQGVRQEPRTLRRAKVSQLLS